MEDFKRFSMPKAEKSAHKPLPFSEGRYGFGTQFTLTHRIKGTDYRVGDIFTHVSEAESRKHDPYILKIGDGIGETCFIDPAGRAVILSADVGVINTIFEYKEPAPKTVVISEGEEYTPEPPPPVFVTESEFKEFRRGLATVLSEIAGIVPTQGDRGEPGQRGERGEQGIPGERGERGEKGEQGERGEPGAQGIPGERGEPGQQGERGEPGESGQIGPRGERGEQGEPGKPGRDGLPGKPGADGKDGKPGQRGEKGDKGEKGDTGNKGDTGEKGEKGERGEKGAKGDRGEKGEPGERGDTGLVTAKFPLVYDPQEKSIAIDEERLDKILKKIMGGGKVSAADMSWLASTGGGGKVAVYHNGTKITPDVRGLNFTGSGVSVTKENGVGGKLIVNITGGGGYGSTGPTGPAGPTGAGGALGYWGSFWSTEDQVATLADTEYQITLNNTDPDSNGVSISNSSRINFAHSGVYSIIYSVQFVNTGSQIEDVDIWLKKNGSNVADTDSRWSVVARHGGVDGHAIGSVNYMLEVNAGDYLELAWKTTHADLSIQYLPAVAPAPAVPSIILTAQQVMYTQVGPTGPTGPTGPMPTDYVSSFNGATGAVQGVSAVNGFTGGFEIRPGRGITYSYSNNGISFEINFARGTGVFPGKSAAGMAYTDIMLFQEKPSGGNTGAMYTANIQNFYDRFFAPNIPPKPSAAELTESPSNSFLMVSLAGNEGYVPFADQMTIISQNLTIVDGGTYT